MIKNPRIVYNIYGKRRGTWHYWTYAYSEESAHIEANRIMRNNICTQTRIVPGLSNQSAPPPPTD